MKQPCPKNWNPEDWSAHLVRCEFAELMGLGYTSSRDPKWLVEKFRQKVLREFGESGQSKGRNMRHTAAPWKIPAANLFKIVAPDAPHENKPSGACPPYPFAVIADVDPESVGGEQAAANARLIAVAPELLEALERLVLYPVLLEKGRNEDAFEDLHMARKAIAKAKGENPPVR